MLIIYSSSHAAGSSHEAGHTKQQLVIGMISQTPESLPHSTACKSVLGLLGMFFSMTGKTEDVSCQTEFHNLLYIL